MKHGVNHTFFGKRNKKILLFKRVLPLPVAICDINMCTKSGHREWQNTIKRLVMSNSKILKMTEGCFRVIYDEKNRHAYGSNETYYIPINTIIGIRRGQYAFPPHIIKTLHKLLFDEGQCGCGVKIEDDDHQCLKYIFFYVLKTSADEMFVVHLCEHDRVKAYIEGSTLESRTKKHKVSK